MLHGGGARMVHPHRGVHELYSGDGAGGEDAVQIGGAEGGRFLQEHVLPVLRRGDGPAEVEAGGKRQVDGVHAGIGKDVVIAGVGSNGGGVEGVVGDKAPGLVEGAAAHGDDGGVGG